MKRTAWLCVGASLSVLVLVALAQRSRSSGGEPPPRKAAPLSLEGLLDEKLPDAMETRDAAQVDNSACYVCHANYQEEELVVSHGKEQVGCIKCHGDSAAHRNDEDNITPPDQMYPLGTIDRMCGECHAKHNVTALKVLDRWRERCPDKQHPDDMVCTDCHYQHRLPRRTVQWDKATRQLLTREIPPPVAPGSDR